VKSFPSHAVSKGGADLTLRDHGYVASSSRGVHVYAPALPFSFLYNAFFNVVVFLSQWCKNEQ